MITFLTLLPILGGLMIVAAVPDARRSAPDRRHHCVPVAGDGRAPLDRLQPQRSRDAARGVSPMGTLSRHHVSRWRRRAESPDACALCRRGAHVAGRLLGQPKADTSLFRARSVPAGRIIWHIYGAELRPLVHFLGAEPDSRVLPGSPMGRPQSRTRRESVLSLHHGRQRCFAARISCALPGYRPLRSDRFGRPCATRPDRSRARAKPALGRHRRPHRAGTLLGRLPRLCRQNPGRPLPHLAARYLCRGSQRNHHAPHRSDVEDGCLRLPADFAAHLSAANGARTDAAALAGRRHHRSARVRRVGAEGPQAYLRLFVH